MSYLLKADLLPFIEQDDLDWISQETDSNITAAITEAESRVFSYLRVRYDVDAITAETGSDRDELILGKLIDISIFILYKAKPSNQIPERRLFFYQEAEQWLNDLAKGGKFDLDLPLKTDTDGKVANKRFRGGSDTQIATHGY